MIPAVRMNSQTPTAQDGWREVPLGELSHRVTKGTTPTTVGGRFTDRGIAFVKVESITNDGRIEEDKLAYIDEESNSLLARSSLEKDDVLFTIAGTIGRVGRVQETLLPANTNQAVAIVRPDRSIVDPKYLYYSLRDDARIRRAHSRVVQSVQANFSLAELSAVEIPLPPLPEQRAIAHVLGTLDDKIELNRLMSETLESMARALFKSWFVDFEPVRAKVEGRWRRGESLPGLPAEHYDMFPDRLVPSELGDVPEGWKVKTLGEVVELAYGKALRAIERKDGPVPVYGSNGQIGWHDKRLVAGPGIIVGRKGNPGVVTWAHGDFFPIDTTFYVVPTDCNGGLPFQFFALTGQDLPSVSADSAVPGLNRNLAYMNRQLVPGKAVLAEFTDCASTILSRQHQLEEECYSLAVRRDALLPRLASGELRVGNAGPPLLVSSR